MSIQRTPFVKRIAATVATLIAAALFAPAPAGATAAPRTYGAAELADARAAVEAADITGTAWYTDTASGTVRVLADTTVSDRDLARLRERADDLAGALAVERTGGVFRPHLRGGEQIFSGGGSCVAGFNVRGGGVDYVATAGHCTSLGGTWYTNPALSVPIGPVTGSSFPGNDYGIIRYANSAVPRPGTVICNGQEIDITGPVSPAVGQRVWHSGPSGCRPGNVTAVNVTVNYANGIVSGLTATNICSQPGESGSPLFTIDPSGTTGRAVGILSGGQGNCTSGGMSFYQPIAEILAVYGLTLL
ncbi:S1 family peptidase [Streptomyces sp. NPDC049879]|uniref:S1 family peptidase n=1 Tax=Streptomyces sp. NPDC049879 TaxID=3365598 RepID=UPI00379DE97A